MELRRDHFRQGEINGGGHRHFARRPLERRRYNDIATINPRDVQNDPVLLLIIDHAPRIACVGVAALQFPMLSVSAHLFKPPDFGAL